MIDYTAIATRANTLLSADDRAPQWDAFNAQAAIEVTCRTAENVEFEGSILKSFMSEIERAEEIARAATKAHACGEWITLRESRAAIIERMAAALLTLS